MRKWWIALLTGIMMMCACGMTVSAAEAVIFDEKGILSDSEYSECLTRLQAAADETGMNVGVILAGRSRSEYSVELTAEETYFELFGENSDGLIYYMDLSGADPYDYILTRGMGQFYYTNSDDSNRINAIFSSLDYYLYPVGSEDAYGALLAFAEEVEYYYYKGVPSQYYVYDEEYNKYFYLQNGTIKESLFRPYIDWESVLTMAFGGFCFGVIAAIFTFIGVKSRYRFKSALSPTAYVNRKNVVYHAQHDNFIRTYTTKVKIESSSSGGGGRRGGGGRSRGGSGGGGHRR